MQAYSSDTDTHYPSWDDLVEAEANGYVAVAILDNGSRTWPWVVGPFSTKREATNARARLRNKIKKDGEPIKFSLFVRPVWKI